MQKEPKKLTGSSQKARIWDKLLPIQLTQTSDVSGEKVNPNPVMF